MQQLDDHATLATSTEMRDLARVLKAALLMVVAHWNQLGQYPTAHPYRQAVRMVVSFLEGRYRV
jgi:hypothetical protein